MYSVKHLLQWLVLGSKGGNTRKKILTFLHKTPSNANVLAEQLKMDYKTIRHHLKILQENQLITSMGSNYGKVFFISPLLEEEKELFKKIIGGEQ